MILFVYTSNSRYGLKTHNNVRFYSLKQKDFVSFLPLVLTTKKLRGPVSIVRDALKLLPTGIYCFLNKQNKLRGYLKELSKVHGNSGFYFIFDKEHNLLYVGESLNLIVRLPDYFAPKQAIKNGMISKTIGVKLDELGCHNYYVVVLYSDLDRQTRLRYESVFIQRYKPLFNVIKRDPDSLMVLSDLSLKHPTAMKTFIYDAKTMELLFVTKTKQDAMAALGLTQSRFINVDNGRPFRNTLLLVTIPFGDNETPKFSQAEFLAYVATNLPKLAAHQNQVNMHLAKGVEIVCVKTNIVLNTFQSQTKASVALGLPMTTLRRNLDNQSATFTYLGKVVYVRKVQS